jgi:hypothetical protein
MASTSYIGVGDGMFFMPHTHGACLNFQPLCAVIKPIKTLDDAEQMHHKQTRSQNMPQNQTTAPIVVLPSTKRDVESQMTNQSCKNKTAE